MFGFSMKTKQVNFGTLWIVVVLAFGMGKNPLGPSPWILFVPQNIVIIFTRIKKGGFGWQQTEAFSFWIMRLGKCRNAIGQKEKGNSNSPMTMYFMSMKRWMAPFGWVQVAHGYNGDLVPEKSLLTVPLKTELIVPLCILRTG